MKRVSTALLAAGLAALGACGGAEENVAANNAADDLYNVAPDESGTDNLLGNEGDGTGLDNLTNGAGDNAAAENGSVDAQ